VSSCWQIQQVRTGRDVSEVEGGVVLGEVSEAWRVGLFISIGSVVKEFVDDDCSGDCWVGEEFLCSEGEDRRDEAWDGADAMVAAGKEWQFVAGGELAIAIALRICAGCRSCKEIVVPLLGLYYIVVNDKLWSEVEC
jgi:hypothetical protein